jgi:ABC-2 type transport system ATP-binding protein
MMEVIRTINLTKTYGEINAVDNLNLSVKQGEIFGFIGLNGAGKTTAIRMLLGMIAPTSGECYIQGQRVRAGNINIWHDVGYIVETPYSYPELTVRENLEIIRKLRGIKDKACVAWIIRKLKLEEYELKKAKHLSLGNAQRLGIAKAIIHKPRILILDEPTNGLDPAGIVEVRKLLKDLTEKSGVTVFISSHKLDEISKITTNIGIIHNGKYEGPARELGIPAVVGCGNATLRLKTGDRVLVDGGQGIVEILK